MTNFEKITKNENTLAEWLSDKVGFCGLIPCDECKINCESEERDDFNNADLWEKWLKQPHTAGGTK